MSMRLEDINAAAMNTAAIQAELAKQKGDKEGEARWVSVFQTLFRTQLVTIESRTRTTGTSPEIYHRSFI